jgi:hypothetical protein
MNYSTLLGAASIVGILVATSASAFDSRATTLTTAFEFDRYEVEVTHGYRAAFNTISVGATVYSYNLGDAQADVFGRVRYDRIAETVGLGVEYTVTQTVDVASMYATAELEYVAPRNDLGKGDVYARPSLGVSYQFTDRFDGFAEIGYAWNASNRWSNEGGYAQVGVGYALTNNARVIGSVVRPFDTPNNSAFANIEVRFSF